jgi:hypothetical protein
MHSTWTGSDVKTLPKPQLKTCGLGVGVLSCDEGEQVAKVALARGRGASFRVVPRRVVSCGRRPMVNVLNF